MKRSILLSFTALFTGAALPAQSILDSIRTPDKAVATVNQTLAGTWLVELHRPGCSSQPASDFKPHHVSAGRHGSRFHRGWYAGDQSWSMGTCRRP